MTLRTGGALAISRETHLTLATHGGSVPSVGASIISAAADVRNGVRLTFQSPAAGAQLPHNGGACWMRGAVYGRDGLLIDPWYPALDLMEMLILERVRPSITPGLIRVGMLTCNHPDPSNVLCTEGWGCFLRYPSTTARGVGLIRVSTGGTWVEVLGTPNTAHFGAQLTASKSALQLLLGFRVTGTDAHGDAAVPQAANIAVYNTANQGATQQRTLGVPITWYTGLWGGWDAAGGTSGTQVTIDPMYWVHPRPGRG